MGDEYEMCRFRMGNGRPDPVFPTGPRLRGRSAHQLVTEQSGDFASLRGSLRARQIQSRLFARGLTIELPRRLKLHKSKILGNPKPVPYLPSCG